MRQAPPAFFIGVVRFVSTGGRPFSRCRREGPCLAKHPIFVDDIWMVKIDSLKKLEVWLKDKPPAWSATVALRAALRMMPDVSNPAYYKSGAPLPSWTFATFRCHMLSSALIRFPNYGNSYHAALAAARGVDDCDYAADAPAWVAADAAAETVRAAAYAITHEIPKATDVTIQAVHAAEYAASLGSRILHLWVAISQDCDFLDALGRNSEYSRNLLSKPLWLFEQPDWFDTCWNIAREALEREGNGFEIWRDWFQRRIDGDESGFDLPPDADAEISRRLIAADNGWWERPPAEVNADIKAWLTELTPPPPEPDEADFTQNPRALTFGPDADEQIDVLPDLAGDRVLSDADARDRHAEARAEAEAALAASSRDLTQAFAIGETLSDYLDALGDSVETTRPSQLVLRGDKLRRLRADYISPTSSKPPLTEDQAFALENWERAHSALVGIDPFLSSIERASYGPAVPATIITLDAIKAIIDSARDANIATVGAQEAITDSVENVPSEAPAGERRLVLATESLKNFIRGTAGFIKQHKGKISAGAVGLAKGAHEAALWIQRNVEWLREALAGEQSILDLINWIASLPL